MRQKRRERQAEEVKRRLEEQDEGSKPLIDLMAEIKPFDEPRRKMLLEFFSDHFLKMAERSAKYRNHGQSYMYLRSAENLITLVKEMGYQCKESQEQVIHLDFRFYSISCLQVMKLRASVNYPLYIKDYWMIAYGHPQLGGSTSLQRNQSLNLPSRDPAGSLPHTPRPQASPANSLPRTPKPPTESQKRKKSVKIEVSADVHDTDSEASSKKTNEKVNLHFVVEESSDFSSEFTHL